MFAAAAVSQRRLPEATATAPNCGLYCVMSQLLLLDLVFLLARIDWRQLVAARKLRPLREVIVVHVAR